MGFEIIKIDRGFKPEIKETLKIGGDQEFDYYVKTNNSDITSYSDWRTELFAYIKKLQKKSTFYFAVQLKKYHE